MSKPEGRSYTRPKQCHPDGYYEDIGDFDDDYYEDYDDYYEDKAMSS